MTPWTLPQTAEIGGTVYKINTDYRDILEIMRYLSDADTQELLRWRIAIALFYEGDVPLEHMQEAMNYLAEFISYGEKDDKRPAPKLLDWDQDAQAIIADVNKVSGTEIRNLEYLHWWSFLSYFYAIGEGQLSTLVSIRDKLVRGKKLESWEQDYYRKNQSKIDFKNRYTQAEEEALERFRKMLEG